MIIKKPLLILRSLCLAIFLIVLDHLIKDSSLPDQLGRTSKLGDPSIIQHENFVVVGDGRDPVGNGYDGGLVKLLLYCLMHCVVSLHIN